MRTRRGEAVGRGLAVVLFLIGGVIIYAAGGQEDLRVMVMQIVRGLLLWWAAIWLGVP